MENENSENQLHLPRGKLSVVLLSTLIAVSVVGFLLGRSQPYIDIKEKSEQHFYEGDYPDAPSYEEIGAMRRKLNASVINPDVLLMHKKLFPEYTEAEIKQAFEKRFQRRAYDGAPPVIPHNVFGRSPKDCMTCHRQGYKIGDKIASLVPHPIYPNCLQCHVVAKRPEFAGKAVTINLFSGMKYPEKGNRAWKGAPPLVPHSLQMRNNCLACHGATAKAGLRSSHPERKSCLQCHLPSSGLNKEFFKNRK